MSRLRSGLLYSVEPILLSNSLRVCANSFAAMTDPHLLDTPSPWVARFAPRIPRSGKVLDVACGAGRHSRLLVGLGYAVLAVDIDLSRLGNVAEMPGVATLQADLENAPWPLEGQRFAGIIVTNYLHRPLFPKLLASLLPDGVLIYETFARGNERFGKPSNPDFLLLPGELLSVINARMRILAYEDLDVDTPKPAAVQRICAVQTEEDNSL